MKDLDRQSNDERLIIDLLCLGFQNLVLLGHYSYKQAKEKLEMHQHTDMLEICFLDSGSQYYLVGKELYLLKGGDLLITPPNIIHGTSSFPEEKGSLFWLIIKVPKVPFKLLNLNENDSKQLIDRILGLRNIHFKGGGNIRKLLYTILKSHAQQNDKLRKVKIQNNLLSFLLAVISIGEKYQDKGGSLDIQTCCDFIKINIYEKIYIKELASRAGLSESRFKHKFKEEIGIPPNEYVIKQKINIAKDILIQEKISITNLAYDLGFSNSSYFSSVFKKYTGVSPIFFRRKSKTLEKND